MLMTCRNYNELQITILGLELRLFRVGVRIKVSSSNMNSCLVDLLSSPDNLHIHSKNASCKNSLSTFML